jgi:regulatory protein
VAVTLQAGIFIIPRAEAPVPGESIDPEELSLLQEGCARSDAQNFLAYSERSSGQLRKKIISLGYSTSVADSILSWALSYGFVDDLRFCSLFAASGTMGRMRLKMELSRRGVPDNVIEKALAAFSDGDSIDELVKVISRRYGRIPDKITARRRASGWLSRRGFPVEVIYRVLREAL